MVYSFKKYQFILAFLCLIANVNVSAQQLDANTIFNNLTAEDGLPTTSVTAVTQDSFGFIWIGSWYGVYLYDGVRFEKMFNDGRRVLADDKGGVWISYQTGNIAYFNGKTEEYEFFRDLDEGLRYLPMIITPNGEVFTSTGQGVMKFNEINREFELEEGQIPGNAFELNFGEDGRIDFLHWPEETPKIGHRSPSGEYTYEDFPEDKNSDTKSSFSESIPTIVFPYQDSGTIILNTNGFAKRNNLDEPWQFKKFSDPDILKENGFENRGAYVINGNEIWLNRINALSKINLESGEISSSYSDQTKSNGLLPLESFHGSEMLLDQQGVLWIPRFSYGISKLNFFQSDFGLQRDESGKVVADVLSAVEMEDGSYWIGARTSMEKGLIHYSADGKQILNRIGAEKERPGPGKSVGRGLSHPYPWVQFITSKGEFYVGTGSPGASNGGLNRIDLESGLITRFRHDPNDPKSLSSNWIFNILEDKKGRLWIRHNEGIDSFDPVSEEFSTLEIPNYAGRQVSHLIDSKGNLLIFVDDAERPLVLYNVDSGETTYPEVNEEISSGVYSIQANIDRQGRVWITTQNGFGYTDENYEEMLHWVPLEEFKYPEIGINAISFDENGNVYFATTNGIIRYNPETKESLRFGLERGLQSNRFSTLNYRGPSGKIYFSGTSGINVFDPEELDQNPYAPEIIIRDVKIDGESWQSLVDSTDRSPTYSASKVVVPPSSTTISISFSSIHFGGNGQNQSEYRLINFDENWQQAGNTGTAIFTNLPEGKYTLEIRSSNLDGVITPEFKTLEIEVLPPWYRTWWAYLIYGILFILLLRIAILDQRRKATKKEREKAKDKELAQAKEIEKAYTELKSTQAQLIQSEKMASLGELTAGIAHEIQNPLNFVNNFSEVSEELVDEMNEELEKGDIEEAKFIGKDLKENLSKINHHGNRAGSIVRGMLEHSRKSEGEKAPTDLNALAEEFLKLSYHGLRAKDKSFSSDYKLELDPNLPQVEVNPQDTGRVVLNLINNAFYAVHEKAKSGIDDYIPTVTVSTKLTPLPEGAGGESIELSVSDNGPGIPDSIKEKIFQPFFTTKPTGSGTGLGLSLSYDIIKAHRGELKVESQEGEGTVFRISLPYIKSNNDHNNHDAN